RRFAFHQVRRYQPAIIGKPVRSMSNPGAAPATVIDAAPLQVRTMATGKPGRRAGRVESPETGLEESTGAAEGRTVRRTPAPVSCPPRRSTLRNPDETVPPYPRPGARPGPRRRR